MKQLASVRWKTDSTEKLSAAARASSAARSGPGRSACRNRLSGTSVCRSASSPPAPSGSSASQAAPPRHPRRSCLPAAAVQGQARRCQPLVSSETITDMACL